MKIIQNIKPIYGISGVETTMEFCCEESRQKRFRDFVPEHQFLGKILNERDLIYKFCPYCGEKTEVVNKWPTLAEVRVAVKSLIDKCGCQPRPIYDALSDELKRKSANEIVNENTKKDLEIIRSLK